MVNDKYLLNNNIFVNYVTFYKTLMLIPFFNQKYILPLSLEFLLQLNSTQIQLVLHIIVVCLILETQ